MKNTILKIIYSTILLGSIFLGILMSNFTIGYLKFLTDNEKLTDKEINTIYSVDICLFTLIGIMIVIIIFNKFNK